MVTHRPGDGYSITTPGLEPEPGPEPWFPSESVVIVGIFTFGVSAVTIAKICACSSKTPRDDCNKHSREIKHEISPFEKARHARVAAAARLDV